MTNAEQIMAWIEASQPHRDKLVYIVSQRNLEWFRSDNRADHALQLVSSAWREMIYDGVAVAIEYSPETLLQATIAVTLWDEKP